MVFVCLNIVLCVRHSDTNGLSSTPLYERLAGVVQDIAINTAF